ncbi:MAG: hypothetical protein J6N52_14940 [Clostridia bacterium]|nr:hypothetical protein [Clostridia bacterium]
MKRFFIFLFLIMYMNMHCVNAEIYTPEAIPGSKKIFETDFSEGNPLTVTDGSFSIYEQPLPVIGEWNFDDGKSDGLTPVGGNFSISGGLYNQTSPDSVVSRAMIEGAHENYSLEFDAKAGNGAATIVVFLGMNSDGYYTFEYSYAGAVFRRSDGTDILTKESALKDGDTVHFKIAVENGAFSAYVNNSEEAFMECTEGHIPAGSVGIGTWASPAGFDNLKMMSLSTEGGAKKLCAEGTEKAAAVFECEEKNIRVSANIKVSSFINAEAGLILRNGYYFLSDGELAYIKKSTGDSSLKTLAYAPCRIKSGEYNLFSARAEGEKLTFSLNNSDIISVFDEQYMEGAFGIYKKGTGILVNNIAAEGLSSDISRVMENTEHKAAYGVLSALGIINTEASGHSYSDNITRLDFAKAVCAMVKLLPSASAVYKDTSSPYARAVSDAGLMSGTGDGFFGASDKIKAYDAAKVLVDAAGYKNDAESAGGYPSGYTAAAARLGITRDIKNEYLTYADACVMILRTLELDRYENDIRNLGGNSILEKLFNVKTVSGIAETHVSTPEIPENELVINDIVLESTDYEITGRFVKCYYTDSPGSDLSIPVYIYKTKTDEITITADKLDKTESKYSVAYEMNGARRRKSIGEKAKIIYNNKYLCLADEAMYSSELLDINEGDVTLVFNSGSDKADFVFIRRCRILLAGRINPSNGEVFDLISGESVYLEAENVVFRYEDGSTASADKIKKYDVLKLFNSMDDDDSTEVILSPGNNITGKIKSIDDNTIQIASDIYKRYKNAGNLDSIRPGTEAVIYFDSAFKAIYAEPHNSDDYAYLVKTVYSDSGSEPSLLLWMYSFSKGPLKAYVSEKASFCDYSAGNTVKKIKSITGLWNSIGNYTGLIRCRTDENNIVTKICLPRDSSGVNPTVADSFELNFYKENCKQVYNSFYSRYIVTPETKQLFIPADREDLDGYYLKPYGALMDDEDYTVAVYDSTEALEAGVVVLYKEPNIYEGRVSIVKNICEAVNESGDKLIGIVLYTAGAEKTIYAKGNLQCDAIGGYNFGTTHLRLTDLKPGDVISYHTDSAGYLRDYLVAFENKEQDYYRTAIYGWWTENIPHSALAIGYARAEKVFQNSFFINMYYGTVNCRPSSSSTVYVYEDSAKQKVRPGSFEDLTEGDDCLCIWNYSTLNDVLIIKK